MRDFDTIETALVAAETGHLVFSTLHTVDATETINRIISVFPPHQQKQIRLQLAAVIKAIISMRLLPRADKKGRVPAVEVMVSTGLIRECIIDSERTRYIPDSIEQGITQYGMQSFDQSLMELLKRKLISFKEAMRRASNPNQRGRPNLVPGARGGGREWRGPRALARGAAPVRPGTAGDPVAQRCAGRDR